MRVFKKLDKQDYFLIILVLLLILPNIFISTKAVVRSVYPFLIIAGALNNRKLFAALTSPVLYFMPGAIYFWVHYHSPINITFWLILFGSNLHEAIDYLVNLKVEIISVCLVTTVIYISAFKKMQGPIFTNNKVRYLMLLFTLVPFFRLGANPLKEDYLAELTHHFAESYPWNVIIGYSAAKVELQKFQNANMNENWILHASQDKKLNKQKQIYVLVIGESARRDRHQVYGYNQETTPEMYKLQQMGQLFIYNDLITLHPHTMDSVPTIMTKQSGVEQPHDRAPSFVDIFKDAGFKVYWLSNQAAMGNEENKISAYAHHADYFHSLHVHSISLPWAYDGELLPEFIEKLKESGEKKLIVLHLQGSHYGFDRRYPKEFNKFKDHYDNTILYTDFILSKIVSELKASNQLSALMYISDHGLMLGECGQYTHFDMKQSYEVPFWIWTSDEWRKVNQQKYISALKNLNKKISTVFVLDSLVDVAGVSYDGFEKSKSVLSKDLVEIFPRNVKTYSRVVDYDHGDNDQECHLIQTDKTSTSN